MTRGVFVVAAFVVGILSARGAGLAEEPPAPVAAEAVRGDPGRATEEAPPAGAAATILEEFSPEAPLRYDDQVAIFGGATTIDGTSYGTVGIDYEHRFGRAWGLGVLADWVLGTGEGREVIVAPAIFFHPFDRIRIDFAPGVELIPEEDATEFMLRLGIDYDFEVGEHWVIAPNVNVDFVNDDFIPVCGIELGYLF